MIGEGSFGKVWLVKRIATDEVFAMKILSKAKLEQTGQRVHTKSNKIYDKINS